MTLPEGRPINALHRLLAAVQHCGGLTVNRLGFMPGLVDCRANGREFQSYEPPGTRDSDVSTIRLAKFLDESIVTGLAPRVLTFDAHSRFAMGTKQRYCVEGRDYFTLDEYADGSRDRCVRAILARCVRVEYREELRRWDKFKYAVPDGPWGGVLNWLGSCYEEVRQCLG